MIDQRTEEWKEQRRGKFTASEIHKLMRAKGLGKTGETYILEKVAEELGATMPEITTYAMQRGTDLEPYAKLAYSNSEGVAVSEQPFIVAPWCDEAGASPDGLVVEFDTENRMLPNRKGLEIKCPMNPVHHVQNMMIKTVDQFKAERPEYYWQVQMCMAVTGLKEWDFVSYFPEIEPEYQLVALTVDADPVDIELLKARIAEAVKIKREILAKL